MSSAAPLKILFVVPKLAGGGAERVVVTLLGALDRKRIQPSIAIMDHSKAAPGFPVPGDVPIFELGAARLRHALPALLKLIWRERPDVVLSTLDHLNIAMAALRPFWPKGVRLIVRATDLMNLDNRRMATLMRLTFPLADGIVYQSAAMRSAFRNRLGLRKRERVINNPVDTSAVAAKAAQEPSLPDAVDDRTLICAGRLTYAKGFDVMLRAVSLARRKDFKVVVLGTGNDLADLERQRTALGLDERVRFLGFQSNPYAFFARGRGFLLSSRYEGFPNVVLEALACGTPVIATPVPGISDLLTDAPGCVVASDFSAEALAQALDGFLDQPHQAIPAELVRPYNAEPTAATYADFFAEVAAAA